MADQKQPAGRFGRDPTVAGLATTGLELGLVVAVLAVGGWWLDGKFGTTPWLFVTGTAIGIVGGLYKFVRISRSFFDRDRTSPKD